MLACTCSLLPQPLWAAVAEVAFLAERNFWLLTLLAEVLCILTLAIFIYQLGHSRLRIESETNASVSSNKLVRFIREAVEQLYEVAAQLRSTTRPHNNRPAGQLDEDGRGVVKGRAELPEAARHGIEDINLARFEAKLRKLTELTKRLYEERKALGTNSIAATRYYLPLDLGGEQLAVSALSVYRVLLATQLVAEPSMPTNIRRAIKLHGTLVPVIDLGSRLGRQPIEIGRDTRIVILDISKGESLHLIGVLADAVGKVLDIPPAAIEPLSARSPQGCHDLSFGTAKANDHSVTLLDLGRLHSATVRPLLRPTIRTLGPQETLQ